MKTLEIRRHAMRDKPGARLSAAGTDLAHFAGSYMGQYDRVITSEHPRAFETAIAMGYKVDGYKEGLGHLPQNILEKLNWPNSLQAISIVTLADPDCVEFSVRQASLWHACLNNMQEESRSLIISHGGIMELGALGCLHPTLHVPEEDPFGYCEGLNLTYEGSTCTSVEFIRMPENRRLIST